MSEDLSKWDFQKELMDMAQSCIGNKKDTARRKAKALFDKYDKIISYSASNNEWYEKEYIKSQRILKCLKSGFIDYDGGSLRILDVEFYKETANDIVVNMKSGKTVHLSKDFVFIHEIFK